MKNDLLTSIRQPYMIFGIDLIHPHYQEKDFLLSIAAMVGSIDQSGTIYKTTIHTQKLGRNREPVEVVLKMEDMVYQLLKVSVYNVLHVTRCQFEINVCATKLGTFGVLKCFVNI